MPTSTTVPPVPPVPPPAEDAPPVGTGDPGADPDPDMATAALIQIAMLCTSAHKRLKDPRIERIKKVALDELNKSGAMELLLTVMQSQQSQQANFANGTSDREHQSRHESREQVIQDYAERIKESRDRAASHREKINGLTTRLYEQLLQNLVNETVKDNPVSES